MLTYVLIFIALRRNLKQKNGSTAQRYFCIKKLLPMSVHGPVTSPPPRRGAGTISQCCLWNVFPDILRSLEEAPPTCSFSRTPTDLAQGIPLSAHATGILWRPSVKRGQPPMASWTTVLTTATRAPMAGRHRHRQPLGLSSEPPPNPTGASRRNNHISETETQLRALRVHSLSPDSHLRGSGNGDGRPGVTRPRYYPLPDGPERRPTNAAGHSGELLCLGHPTRRCGRLRG